jgi:preprotein translocase subunit SecB
MGVSLAEFYSSGDCLLFFKYVKMGYTLIKERAYMMIHSTPSPEAAPAEPKFTLHRILNKGSVFEAAPLTRALLENPLQPTIELKIGTQVASPESNFHEVVMDLQVTAKHNGSLVWRAQIQQAGFYTLEGFEEAQIKPILHGFCMNQIYPHASAVLTYLVTQGGFPAVYLTPLNFEQIYQEQQKEAAKQATVEPLQVSMSD